MPLILDILGTEDDTFFSYMSNCRTALLNKIYTILLIIRNRKDDIDAKLKDRLF